MKHKKNIVFFTSSYPYGNGESFIKNELEILCQRFENVTLIPLNKTSSPPRTTPKNCKVITLNKIKNSKRNLALKHFRVISIIIAGEIKSQNLLSTQGRHIISALFKTLEKSDQLEQLLKSNKLNYSILYSFWLNEWASILSILKFENKITNYYGKAHGFDLYPEQTLYKKTILHRKFQLKQITKLFLISKNGIDFLNLKHPKYKDKYYLSYLGTEDFGTTEYSPSNEITIITIARLTRIKRINILLEALKNTKNKINWIHIGSGGEQELDIKKRLKTLPSNITAVFKGHITNKEVKTIMLNQNITCLLNISITEGIPVSIMEAISCGIPVIATDVGGSSEIVNDQTGIVIPKDFSISFLSNLLDQINSSKLVKPDFRKQIKPYWEKNFNNKKNTNQFIDQIINSNN